MIQANELRIGNWILFSPSGKKSVVKDRPVKVKTIYEGQVLVDDNGLDLELFYGAATQPIPLTPDILEKCSFKVLSEYAGNWKEPDYTIWSDRNFLIGEKDGKFFYYAQCEDDFYSWYSPEITSLHQLQNLYHSLTGKELIYKP